MKQTKIIIAIICITACFSGCVSQSEYDSLNVQLSELQSEVSEKEILISEKDTKIADLENNVKALEENNKKISDEKTALEEKVDELEHGASRLLSDVNNAFEDKDYEKAVKVANELHNKFNGSEEDTKAQAVAKQAQAEIDKIEAEKKAEEERKAAEEAKSKEEKLRKIIRIGGTELDDTDSAGGVSFSIYYRNESDKEIKYLYFTVSPYNAVGDKVSSSIGNESTIVCKATGPFAPTKDKYINSFIYYKSPKGYWEYIDTFTGEYTYSYYNHDVSVMSADYYNEVTLSYSDLINAMERVCFSRVWYNSSIREVKIDSIKIEYMDGTTEIISNDELKYIMY